MKKKKMLKILGVILFCFFLLGIFKDQVIRIAVTSVAGKVMGTSVKISGLSLNIFTQAVRIKGLQIYNPPGYPKGIMVDLPQIFVDIDLPAIFKKKLHLETASMHLKEIRLVKGKDGKLNVDTLKPVEKSEKKEIEPKAAEDMPLQIDEVNLEMGRVIFTDYSGSGKEPVVSVYDINLKKTYRNIQNAQQLVVLILSEPMKAAGIKGAAIYGVSAIAGMAVMPVAIAATFTARDYVEQEFNLPLDRAFDQVSKLLKEIGTVSKESKQNGVISANVNTADVTVKFQKVSSKVTKINVSARKLLLPKSELAGGVLLKISERLK